MESTLFDLLFLTVTSEIIASFVADDVNLVSIL